MIINPIKRVAARKKITALVEEREASPFPGSVKTLGIILDSKNSDAYEELQKIKKALHIPAALFKVVLFTGNNRKDEELPGLEFRVNHIDIRANIISEEIKKFTVEGVDLLITFAAENNTAVHLLTAYCKAGIKVGRYQQNRELYDLILQTEGDAALFTEELLKYLKHIKRL